MSRKRKKNAEQKFTYYAFYGDGTVKHGFCSNVMNRIRTLGGSSTAFVVFSAEHDDTQSAVKSESINKKNLVKFVLQDAECQEWLNPKAREFFPTLQKSLESLKMKVFKYAFAVGQKTDPDWELTTPADVKKLVTGK